LYSKFPVRKNVKKLEVKIMTEELTQMIVLSTMLLLDDEANGTEAGSETKGVSDPRLISEEIGRAISSMGIDSPSGRIGMILEISSPFGTKYDLLDSSFHKQINAFYEDADNGDGRMQIHRTRGVHDEPIMLIHEFADDETAEFPDIVVPIKFIKGMSPTHIRIIVPQNYVMYYAGAIIYNLWYKYPKLKIKVDGDREISYKDSQIYIEREENSLLITLNIPGTFNDNEFPDIIIPGYSKAKDYVDNSKDSRYCIQKWRDCLFK
jgi:hypothetical protein